MRYNLVYIVKHRVEKNYIDPREPYAMLKSSEFELEKSANFCYFGAYRSEETELRRWGSWKAPGDTAPPTPLLCNLLAFC